VKWLKPAYCWIAALGLASISNNVVGSLRDGDEFFENRIRPLLVKNCYSCHTGARMGGLELTSRQALLKGGNSGPAVVPGEPEKSLLLRAVAFTHDQLKMPPQGKLSGEEIEDLTSWIKMGVVWPETGPPVIAPKKAPFTITPEHRDFWAFRPVQKPLVPKVRNTSWPQSPLDSFILAKLEAERLKPVGAAKKRVLIRRAYFDLIGLPPKPEDVDAFLRDSSAGSFAKVVDNLLASPHYGERWGRYWLDIARYSDDAFPSGIPYPTSFRYRDWVVQAFNEDMPYDLFIKAQLAGDLLEQQGKKNLAGGLGFYALSQNPILQDDRVDVTTRGLLGLTVACAQCHDHKYDPIPTKDYYGLQGVFSSTENCEYPFGPEEQVAQYQEIKGRLDDRDKVLREFSRSKSQTMAQILASQSSQYLMAAKKVLVEPKQASDLVAREDKLDQETLNRWVAYLQLPLKDHGYLRTWDDLIKAGGTEAEFKQEADKFQTVVFGVMQEKREIDEKNLIARGGKKEGNAISGKTLVAIDRDKYMLWSNLLAPNSKDSSDFLKRGGGILYYADRPVDDSSGKKHDCEIDRFLSGEWKAYVEYLRAEVETLKQRIPKQPAFLQAIKDVDKPANVRVQLGGNPQSLGEEVPRRFLAILCDGECVPFSRGSGRLELAEAIASSKNPLTARVLVNRLWEHHFGRGIVGTPSNFGKLGEPPTHPELLDYLTSRFLEKSWSIKAMHREIMLSATYALSSESSDTNSSIDPDNRLLWRANRRRLDAESLRDSILLVSGKLDRSIGGPPAGASNEHVRRTLYTFVSRMTLDEALDLFDFPNPNITSEHRFVTSSPLQQLFLLNSGFVMSASKALADRLSSESGRNDASKIRRAYDLLYGREPSHLELRLGLEFLNKKQEAWPSYAQALLGSPEFLFIN